jgi:hypothetical protein
MSVPTMAELKNLMPKQEFPSVGSEFGDPTCKEVYALYEAACANVRKIPSNRGDGLLGHFIIIAGPGRYVQRHCFCPTTTTGRSASPWRISGSS